MGSDCMEGSCSIFTSSFTLRYSTSQAHLNSDINVFRDHYKCSGASLPLMSHGGYTGEFYRLEAEVFDEVITN